MKANQNNLEEGLHKSPNITNGQAKLETETFEQFKASYIAKVETGELYESPHETFERENFSLTFWHKKFYNHI